MENIPKEFGYVAATALAVIPVNLYMTGNVMNARKKYNVKYPTMYADSATKDGYLFNCVQRGHQNFVEMVPTFYCLLGLGGLEHPLTAAGLGALYLVSRIFYFNGYSKGDPEKRAAGHFGYIGFFGLLFCAGKFAFKLCTK